MKRVFKKVFFIFLSILIAQNIVLALNSEYQNSLVRVELLKTGDNSFNIELYTKNKFLQPVKVIKKSDLNYYILLPETENNISRTSTNSSEIRSVTSKTYKYAGQDVQNGYTKVNINTTKPVNFKVNVKLADKQAKAKKVSKVAQNSNLKPQVQNNGQKVQKKNSISQSSKNSVAKKQSSKIVSHKAENQTVSKPKKEVENLKENQQKVEKKNSVDTVEKIREDFYEQTNELLEDEDKTIDNQIVEQPLLNNQENEVEKVSENIKPVEPIIKNDFLSRVKSKLVKIKKRISNILSEYGIGVIDLILMSIVALISFICMYSLLNKKSNNTKLKSKADLIDKEQRQRKQNKQSRAKNNNGQYFVFDSNIRQTGFSSPTSSIGRKRYELSSYKPTGEEDRKQIEISPYIGGSGSRQNQNDIIHKVFKTDNYFESSLNNNRELLDEVKTDNEIKNDTLNNARQEIRVEPKVVKQEKTVQEENASPSVMSRVEIAPERGFMCVSYNDNISLMGYIFDDVYAIYNFNQPKLENYEIQYRLTEKNGDDARFIVKIDNTKMLVKVTKTSMSLEILL